MPRTTRFNDTLYNHEWLRREYVEKGRNAAQIASELDTNRQTVLARLRRFGIEVRSVSETQKLRTDGNRGSNVPRPKGKYRHTLNDPNWLTTRYVERRMSATDIAKEIGCAIPSVIAALKRAGVTTRSISEAKQGRPTNRVHLPDEELSLMGSRVRARKLVPLRMCDLCAKDFGRDVNHRDRNPHNNAIENLERLCPKCHVRQHREEERVMIEKLAALGVRYIEIYDEARRRLLAFGADHESPGQA